VLVWKSFTRLLSDYQYQHYPPYDPHGLVTLALLGASTSLLAPLSSPRGGSLAQAAPIKRWSESSDDERLDPENDILLSPNLDSLFDRHLIYFTDEGRLVRSSRVTVDDLIKMGINDDVVIPISDGTKKYLDHHRERVVDPEELSGSGASYRSE